MAQDFRLTDLVRPRTGVPMIDRRMAIVDRVDGESVTVQFIDGAEPPKMRRESGMFEIVSRAPAAPPSG